jgi:glycosyltransferase involved in cell wall biosynthesis
VRFHRAGWRAVHWSDVHQLLFGWHTQLLWAMWNLAAIAIGLATTFRPLVALGVMTAALQTITLADELLARFAEARGRERKRQTVRAVRFLWRWAPVPHGRTSEGTVEVLVWRGRFRWRSSRRIAIVQDMTTRIHPELHTAPNVVEFDEFLAYVQRHAHVIATPSAHSKADIIDRIAVCPDSVQTFPMPVHPQYSRPTFSRGIARYHCVPERYVLCVGAIEPRKNLRRLVKAFELAKHDPASVELALAIAGPAGWDPGFIEFLAGTDVARDVHVLGFVPLEHLPSLYHFASAVVCASVYEGFGLPVLEAMCCSGIVVASRSSSLPEVLGEEGMLFDPYSTEGIAGALLRATTLSAAEESNYRRYCRRRAESHLERIAREGPLPRLRQARITVGA